MVGRVSGEHKTLAAVVENRAQAVAEYRRTRSAELAEAERKSIGFRDDLIKAEQRSRQQTLLAPVDGIVQQLSVHTIGGVGAGSLMIVICLRPAECR